jgi:hypothetical protein
MKRWSIRYFLKPTAYNRPQVAVIEAESAEAATLVLMHHLGDTVEQHRQHVYEAPIEVPDEPPPPGRVVSIDAKES